MDVHPTGINTRSVSVSSMAVLVVWISTWYGILFGLVATEDGHHHDLDPKHGLAK